MVKQKRKLEQRKSLYCAIAGAVSIGGATVAMAGLHLPN